MYTDSPRLDYLRLTTFNRSIFDKWMQSIYPLSEGETWQERYEEGKDFRHKKVMQYDGQDLISDLGSIFVGVGLQNGRDHFMLQSSGDNAHDTFGLVNETLADPETKCTRIDIQLTTEVASFNSHTFYTICAFGEWPLKNPTLAPSPRVIMSKDGMDTVYVGNRQSERFHRWYVKRETIDDDEIRFLRFEVEFKGNRAKQIIALLNDGESIASLLLGEYQRLPSAVHELPEVNKLGSSVKSHAEGLIVETANVKTDTKTLRWIRRTVVPSLTRLLNSHTERDIVAAILVDLLYTAGFLLRSKLVSK